MNEANHNLRVVAAGLGNMGRSHALACHNNPGIEIVGRIDRSPVDLPDELRAYPIFTDYRTTLATLKPDLVSINPYPDTHPGYAIMALENGAHVFVEKPIATTVKNAVQSLHICLAADKSNRSGNEIELKYSGV